MVSQTQNEQRKVMVFHYERNHCSL